MGAWNPPSGKALRDDYRPGTAAGAGSMGAASGAGGGVGSAGGGASFEGMEGSVGGSKSLSFGVSFNGL